MDVERPLLADAPSSTGPLARVFADRYQLVARRGSNVDVARFDAVDMHTGRSVVVRIVHPDLCAIDGFADRFAAAMSVVMQHPHPNLAEVYDVGEADWVGRRVLYVVGEQLAGGSLRDLRDRGRLLSQSQAVMIGLDACRGLDVAHRAGLVHADIRPANLVFGDDGRLRITDLGLAAVVADELWKTPEALNLDRARFASPEQALGRPAEQKSDVYSLCLCLVESITGQVPFVGESTVMTLSNRVDRLLPVTADLGPLASVFERAGRPDPGDRSSVAEFGRALVAAAEKLPRPAPLPLLAEGLFAEAPPAVADAELEEAVDVELVDDAAAGVAVDEMLIGAPQVAEPAAASTSIAPAVGAVQDAKVVGASPADEPSGVAPAQVDATIAMMAAQVERAVRPPLETVLTPVTPTGGPAGSTGAPARRRLPVPAWVAGLLVIALVGLGGYLLFGRTTSHEIPLLNGLDQAEALNLVAEFGWEVVTVEEPDETVAIGAVIRTDPPGGERLAEGETLTIVVSGGAALAVLPELTGLTVDEADALLRAQGVVLQLGEQPYDESVPAGSIVSWTVPDQPGLTAGNSVVPGTTVLVTVSAGPAPRVVPELTGLSLADATAALQTLGLTIAQAPDGFDPVVPVGAVAQQDPAPGTEVVKGSTVTIVISKGPELVAMPGLAGLDLAGVTAAFEAAGLVLGDVAGDPAGTIVEARLGDTVLAGGEQVPKGSTINITLSAPAAPTTPAPAP
jgi:beta-lactam-binding protein with PASTA domain